MLSLSSLPISLQDLYYQQFSPEMSIFCYVSPIQASKPTKVIGLQNEVNDKGLDEELGTDC